MAMMGAGVARMGVLLGVVGVSAVLGSPPLGSMAELATRRQLQIDDRIHTVRIANSVRA